MNNILSRVITGIIGLISGVIFSILISYLSAYIVNATVPDGGGMMSGPGLTYAIFYIFGGILGSCVGTAIGVSQFKVLKSLALGAGVTFLLFLIFLGWIGGGDMGYAEGRKGVYFIFSIVLIYGCFVSLLVGLVCNGLMKLFFQQNIETNSSLE
jgi:hypothetical protein